LKEEKCLGRKHNNHLLFVHIHFAFFLIFENIFANSSFVQGVSGIQPEE
jgi:hypothetical protein